MNWKTVAFGIRKHTLHRVPLVGVASCLLLAVSPLLRAAESLVEIGPAAGRDGVR